MAKGNRPDCPQSGGLYTSELVPLWKDFFGAGHAGRSFFRELVASHDMGPCH